MRIAFGKRLKFIIAMATLKPIANGRFHHIGNSQLSCSLTYV